MKYREAQIFYPKDVGEKGVEIIDIDVQKPISRINIKFTTTKTLEHMTAESPANIPRIELVDGSLVLHSLTGFENQALAYYNRPHAIMDHGQHIRSNSEEDHYTIDFGRYLWDEQLAFDPLRFHNPQLKITYDEDVADTGVTANELSVWADIFDEKQVSPLGFLLAVEHYSYTCGAAASFEEISLPSDRVIRQMLVRAYRDKFEPWNAITEARLDEGTLDRIPWDYTSLENYYRRMKGVWRRLDGQLLTNLILTARAFWIPATDYYATFMQHGVNNSDQSAYESAVSSKGGYCQIIGTTAGKQASGSWAGYLPWHCFQFPFGKQMDIEDWFDPTGKRPRLRLRAGSGGTSGTGQVVLEELYKY
ncbi:hypothetical protein LCGC14_0915680 [marine sediment metagenome]|uniref:Uncharacterized protein n=1 Tax=marine sediment metagenome TaxID=412755 RepID=A0A0F9RB24_9ZZZZ